MPKSQYSYVIPALFILALAVSCSDKKKTADDKTGPTISVITPNSGQTYAVGDTIFFEADVEDESELADIRVNLIHGADTILMWPDPPVGLGNISSYTINNWMVDNLNITADAMVQFFAMDKHDNSTSVEIPVQLTN